MTQLALQDILNSGVLVFASILVDIRNKLKFKIKESKMNQNISYGELYMRLASETAMIRFLKKNGEIRLMLATRNMDTASSLYDYLGGQLAGHDKRCNIKNNNMAVIDLEIGEARSFSLDRLISVEFLGTLDTPAKVEEAFKTFNKSREDFENSIEKSMSMDMLD